MMLYSYFVPVLYTHPQRFLVSCSFVEIYTEDVYDLLCKPSNKRVKLSLHQDPDRGVYVKVGGMCVYVCACSFF